MKEGRELYKRAELPAGANVEPCPVCGADAELWQHSETGRTRIVTPDMIVTADATWLVVSPLYAIKETP